MCEELTAIYIIYKRKRKKLCVNSSAFEKETVNTPSCLFILALSTVLYKDISFFKQLYLYIYSTELKPIINFFLSLQNKGSLMSTVLTENEVQLGIRLEGVVERDEERRLADVLQHLPLGPRVLSRLRLLHNGGLLQDLHGVQLAGVVTAHLPHQEHLAVRWTRREASFSARQTDKHLLFMACACVRQHGGGGVERSPHLLFPAPLTARSSQCRPSLRGLSGWLGTEQKSPCYNTIRS